MQISFSQWPKARRVLVTIALVLLAACLAYLALGPKPWASGMASVPEGAEMKTSHFRVSGMWFGALANALLCLLAIALSGWLTRPLADAERSFDLGGDTPPHNHRLWIAGSVLIAIIVTLTGTLPRMDNALWHDEDKTVRNFIIGQFLRSKTSGEVKYREVTWEETVWNSRTPNHTLNGILARISHNVFPPDGDPAKPFLNEWPLRLPALLGALGGLAMLAVALSTLGFHRAAMIAPLLLSIHPWFLRYASEMRGYSLLFLLVPLCVYLLTMAMRTARWKWWVMLGIAEFLTVYAVLNGAHFLVFLNLAALAWMFTDSRRTILLRRWLVTCAVAMLLGIQMMSAFLPQFKAYMESTTGDSGSFDRAKLKDNVTSFASGMRYQDFGEKYAPSYKLMIEETAQIPTALMTLAVFGCAIAGAVRLCRRGTRGVGLLAVCLLPAPFFYFHAIATDAHIFYWYTIVGLPMFWALIAIGAGWFSKNKSMLVTAATAGGFLAIFFWATFPQRQFQLGRPIEANRDSVYLTRDILDPRDPRYDDSITLNVSRHPMVYDGAAHRAKTPEDFLRWLTVADQTNRPLFLNYGSEVYLKRYTPELLEFIQDPALFEEIRQYYGVDPLTNRTVKKYIPGSYKPTP